MFLGFSLYNSKGVIIKIKRAILPKIPCSDNILVISQCVDTSLPNSFKLSCLPFPTPIPNIGFSIKFLAFYVNKAGN